MARRKVKNGEKRPWGQCLTRPVPNGRRRSEHFLYRNLSFCSRCLCLCGYLTSMLCCVIPSVMREGKEANELDPKRRQLGTLLARFRVISHTPSCLACHFSGPVHSPYSLKSRGRSHLLNRTQNSMIHSARDLLCKFCF